MKNFSERALQIQQRMSELTPQNPKIDLYGSKEFTDKSNKVVGWMKEAGLETKIDNIGNVRGILKSKTENAKTFVIGSHLDTGVGAEKYDGILGVLAGLEIINSIREQQLELLFNVELIAFVEEEGLRFNYTNLGSRVVAGTFENKLLQIKDKNGTSLSDVLQSLNFDPSKLKDDAKPTEEFLGYYEIHVEQGCVLADANIPVGITTSIYGQKRIEIIFSGKDGHAGTVPMDKRNDALAAAAKFITSVEKYARREKRNVVATVGKIKVHDSASNKIAGTVTCTLDLRGDDEELLSEAYEIINSLCEKICGKRNIYFEWKLIQETDPVICNKKLKRLLATSITDKNIEFEQLVSGAVYDAAIISKVAPVVILLIKSPKGGNDIELEEERNNIATALQISDNFIQQLIPASEKSVKKKEKEK